MGDSWAELGVALVQTDKHLLGSLMLFLAAAGLMALVGYRMHLDDKRKAAQEAINIEYAKCGNDRRHNAVSPEDLVALERRVMEVVGDNHNKVMTALGEHDGKNDRDIAALGKANAAAVKEAKEELAADIKELATQSRNQGEMLAGIKAILGQPLKT